MNEAGEITSSHHRRPAAIYVRQSVLAQAGRNKEPTARQHDLAARARQLGWPASAVRVIDGDLGVSGSVPGHRGAFDGLVAEVALGQAGIILALEVSRLVRGNAAWYRLLDLAGACGTLAAGADGICHPGLFDDRLIPGLEGIMSEAGLHVLRARLDGGIRSTAARGRLRRGLPARLARGEAGGQIGFHPDEAVTGVTGAVFEQLAACGSVRGVWLRLRDQGLRWPLPGACRRGQDAGITWAAPACHAVHATVTNPAYAGACAYGRTRSGRCLDSRGVLRSRRREMPCGQWEVLIAGRHEGWVTWETCLASQQRIAGSTRPQAHQPGAGAVREGSAQLQGLASCGICGRRLAVFCDGTAESAPGYFCAGTGTGSIGARGTRHLRAGGPAIDAAVTGVFLAALAPAALQARPAAAGQLEDGYGTALDQRRRQLEQARYAATRAERRCRPADPGNRLAARGLETERETALGQLADAGAGLARREQARPRTLTAAGRAAILSPGDNPEQARTAPATTGKDRKQLLRALLGEVTVSVHRDGTEGRADLLLRWKGGAISELAVPVRRQPPKIRTDEGTIDLIRRLAVRCPDAPIAGILSRQRRRTARGLSYTPARVRALRFRNDIPGRRPSCDPQEGELLTVAGTAREPGLDPSTVHRWLNEGFIHGEQLTPGAPRRIRLTGEIRALPVDDTPGGWPATLEAAHAYGLSRQTPLQRVKRGEIRAAYLRTGRKKGLRIAPPALPEGLS